MQAVSFCAGDALPCFAPSYGPLWVRAVRGKAGDDDAHQQGEKHAPSN